jgi:hypothetical protein
MCGDLRPAHGAAGNAGVTQEPLGEHPGAGAGRALRDGAGGEVVDASDTAWVVCREHDALLAAPEVDQDRLAPCEDARCERGVVATVAVAQVQRRRIGAALPQRGQATEAPAGADALGVTGDAVQERVVAARQPQARPAVQRPTRERCSVVRHPGRAPRRAVDHPEPGELGVRASDGGGRRAVFGRRSTDARQRRARREGARRDAVKDDLRDVAVQRHARDRTMPD